MASETSGGDRSRTLAVRARCAPSGCVRVAARAVVLRRAVRGRDDFRRRRALSGV